MIDALRIDWGIDDRFIAPSIERWSNRLGNLKIDGPMPQLPDGHTADQFIDHRSSMHYAAGR
ncbi:MAG: hypothetical protein A3F70_03410 [Acidobacteria bacterium RIFCSPLOWO2_12_FULL_67_14]|nr:MAG: hypothetical protein A3H29_14230 [Acidobacteria bacterium RIFCSPLOWO2_02_FULL_67_21]OFW38831.1 MAG: hypothetical protein A3F70_03410 [Acidobacteria bacterium RIFCSPLOWO2_12_FULL_67_14]